MHGGVRNMKGEKQMIYKNITFKADPFSYDLEFDDRITLVGGDSGTGKTVLSEDKDEVVRPLATAFTDITTRIYGRGCNFTCEKILSSRVDVGGI